MKKLIAIALLALFTAACTPTENTGMMGKGMMCEKCSCCQKMMEGNMKGGVMKEGMQCPMMKNGAKDSKSCSCCKGMMKDGMNNMNSSPAKSEKPQTTDDVDHKAHHPQQ